MKWQDWKGVREECQHKAYAIYEFRIIDQEGRVVSIPRFAREDQEGILCIGKASNMARRLKQFRTGVEKCNGHSEAKLIHLVNKHCDNFSIDLSKVQYRYCKCSESELDQIEEEHIKAYVKKYGEVPPFNSSIPKRYGEW